MGTSRFSGKLTLPVPGMPGWKSDTKGVWKWGAALQGGRREEVDS